MMERTVAELIANDIGREHMTVAEHKAFVDYWFDRYEQAGFCHVLQSPHKEMARMNGQKFEVLGRCSEDTHDLDALPAWRIRLEIGAEMDAYPEEICELERLVQKGVTVPMATPLSAQIQAASSQAAAHHSSGKTPEDGFTPER